ncbi:FAD linked oxidase domain protein [Beutenbergia cavernae DSM 12333]|uniref:FAD linked oxidase domain protein n=1 Tax=Beutenbergia cavernae (strain ATCC BAA-8 / DSM 12333 / CCUG 43141 / JCM 11478 / NBRC 16432 / NCIMB 13614 / HKI 0122) TaxID=471853 RepID=C5BYI9_BEUC1|nr:FAD-binding and (Fe-S)-binding domain-containing protein [Beutenbergia cavernae]ACQ78947.1 FAD linked oxidase domain protein [Beutenbergia cavernae DSM 12333]
MSTPARVRAPHLARDLADAVAGGVDDSARRRAEYSSDASNYRVVPQVVVFPASTDDVVAALGVAREHGAPVTARGGGTSVAGNAVGPGVVLDFSRHLDAILDVDPTSRTARVQPGVVMSSLQAAARPHGLRFGPDPSTQARATLGGMIGNNACGPHAVAWGRTADNVRALEAIDGTGRAFTAASGRGALDAVPGLERLVADHLALIRTELGRFSRQVSGYSLEHLLPENGSNLARALVGTEGTLFTLLEATVDLVPIPAAPILVALGYPDMASAADAVPALLPHAPLAVEGMDARLVDVVRRHHGTVPELPPGGGWLLVEVGGADDADALARAKAIAADAGTSAARVVPAGAEAAAMWRIREDGAGLAGRTPSGDQAWPGWEDAAVPPERLGAYLREFEQLMASYGVDGLPYGHFGDGCVHVRIDVPLDRRSDLPGFESFMVDAARLVAAHGGSLSGEHGDGRARSALLGEMYSAEALDLFGAVKALFDPADGLNPGVLVRPAPITTDLRRPAARPLPIVSSGFAFPHDGGDLTRAVHRCVGVGKCRADTSAAGGFMCPSYLATRDEKDSTRGRARVLQELANGTLVRGWDSPEVAESLDLCLSCKACGHDCPAGVDMATYKAEVTHRRYRRRLRPVTHYALGWLPRWARLTTAIPAVAGLANLALRVAPLRKAVLAAGGMDTRRTVPAFTTRRFSRWFAARHADPLAVAQKSSRGGAETLSRSRRNPLAVAPESSREGGGGREVLLWADSFSEYLAPDGAQAIVRLLTDAGYTVRIPSEPACCGLTWISTGQLDGARRRLTQTLDVLSPAALAGMPIVGIEPSCTAVLRSDLGELFPDDPRAAAVAAATRTLAELLTDPELGPGEDWFAALDGALAGVPVVAQPHCHQHAVMGYERDLELLRRAGADVQPVAGCCGLAGNFGMERGHYDVSVAVAENGLLPALRAAGPDAVLLADGFSCRTQADHLVGVRGRTLAELLVAAERP